MTAIAILGPGAIGLSIAHALHQAGHTPHLFGRRPLKNLTFEPENGAASTHPVTWFPVPDSALTTAYDWLFVCVKSHQTEAAAKAINALISPQTRVAILQNGVEHIDTLAPLVAKDTPLIPAIIDIPVTRITDEQVAWRGKATAFVPESADGEAFCKLFEGSFLQAQTTDDWITKAWLKLCVNAPGGAITALTRQPMKVFHKAGIADIARAILRETIAVGRAEGAKIPDDLEDRQMQSFLNSAPETGNSMYVDAINGVETEWRARNAVIFKNGAKHGIPTPVSSIIVPLLAAMG